MDVLSRLSTDLAKEPHFKSDVYAHVIYCARLRLETEATDTERDYLFVGILTLLLIHRRYYNNTDGLDGSYQYISTDTNHKYAYWDCYFMPSECLSAWYSSPAHQHCLQLGQDASTVSPPLLAELMIHLGQKIFNGALPFETERFSAVYSCLNKRSLDILARPMVPFSGVLPQEENQYRRIEKEFDSLLGRCREISIESLSLDALFDALRRLKEKTLLDFSARHGLFESHDQCQTLIKATRTLVDHIGEGDLEQIDLNRFKTDIKSFNQLVYPDYIELFLLLLLSSSAGLFFGGVFGVLFTLKSTLSERDTVKYSLGGVCAGVGAIATGIHFFKTRHAKEPLLMIAEQAQKILNSRRFDEVDLLDQGNLARP